MVLCGVCGLGSLSSKTWNNTAPPGIRLLSKAGPIFVVLYPVSSVFITRLGAAGYWLHATNSPKKEIPGAALV